MWRRLRFTLVCCTVAVAAFVLWQQGPFSVVPATFGDDWSWYADGIARFWSADRPLIDPRLLAGPYDRLDPALMRTWNQLPFALTPLVVVEWLAGTAAQPLWGALMSGATIAALISVWPRRVSFAAHLSLALVLIAQGPIHEVLLWGNYSALSVAGAALLIGRRTPRRMAVGLILIAFKGPMAAVAALWLLRAEGRRAVRPIAAAVLVVGALTIVPLLRFGIEMIPQTAAALANSLPAPYYNNLSPALYLSPWFPSLPVAVLAALVALPCLLLGLRRPAADPAGLAWLLLGICVLSTTTWAHWYAAPLIVAMAAGRPRLERALRAWAA